MFGPQRDPTTNHTAQPAKPMAMNSGGSLVIVFHRPKIEGDEVAGKQWQPAP